MNEKKYTAKRQAIGGGSYKYRGRNIELLDGRWMFVDKALRTYRYTKTLKDAKFMIDREIERLGA